MEITIYPYYQATPEKEFIKQMTVWFATYEVEQVKAHFAENIHWLLVGDSPIIGKENFATALNQMKGNKATELIIHSILVDGLEAAISGTMRMEDGNSYGFSDFYRLTVNGKVEAIRSYVVKMLVS